jgi:hypothetical protein
MQPDEATDEERQEELPQDNQQTPFQPAAPSRDDTMPADEAGQTGQSDAAKTDDTHPDTDTDIDSQELYDAGVDSAAGMEEPNAGNAVVDYTPPVSDEEADKADSPS